MSSEAFCVAGQAGLVPNIEQEIEPNDGVRIDAVVIVLKIIKQYNVRGGAIADL
jgi:hypothetical protein